MMDIALSSVPVDALHCNGGDSKGRGPRSERTGYQTSPHVENKPENNVCEMVDYRSRRVASFNVDGRQLICLPQAFEIFLKHLVGGLHTVYTKLKRLEITPVVCNVEQVRILRGVAAIQPGVNRCKLISPHEFDVLFEDCTSSSARPGRPPKRSSFYSSADVPDLSPHKQMRRAQVDSNIFHFDDLKPVNPPAPQAPYPPIPIPGMPFVSPYQINMMHQAAVQMALANHIQSSINRAKEGVVPPPLPFYNPKVPPIESNYSPNVLQSPASSKGSPTAANSIIQLPRTSRSVSCPSPHNLTQHRPVEQTDVSGVVTHRSPSPASCCSEDLNVDEVPQTAEDFRNCSKNLHHQIPTPPPSSPREPEESRLIAPDKPLDSKRHPSRENEIENCTDINRNWNKKESLEAAVGADVTNICTPGEEDKPNVEDLLANIKADIESFTESVIQHQEELLADLDVLRDRLRAGVFSKEFIEMFMREQQRTKAMCQAQTEKSAIKRRQINNLMQMAHSEVNERTNPHL